MTEYKSQNSDTAVVSLKKPQSKPLFQGRQNKPLFQGRSNNRGGFKGGKPNTLNKRQSAQLTAEKLEQLRAAKARKQMLEATRKALIQAFPQTFAWKFIKPLKVAIHKDIFDYFNSESQPSSSPVKKVAIRQFLAKYIRSKEYQIAVLKSGKRYDLHGNVVAEFTPEELEYHQTNLKSAQSSKPKKNKPSGFRPRTSGAKPFMKRSTPNSANRFKVGDVVLLNGREGSITKIEDGKYRVQFLDSKLTINVDAKQSYTMKKKFVPRNTNQNQEQ